MPKKENASRKTLPHIWCDFNSAGWSGEDSDECLYVFDDKALAACRPRDGTRVFIFERGQGEMIVGCEAVVQSYPHPVTGEKKWRLQPVHETGYMGEATME